MIERADLFTNYTVLCVDDEETILAAYRDALTQPESPSGDTDDLLFSRRERRKGAAARDTGAEGKHPAYKVLTASSGEQAIETVRSELTAGRRIAAGFFDVVMPGGIDGIETITRILDLDSQILCAVVTAYTDRSPDQIGRIFKRQDDWLYFNKPFSLGEVRQTACHLVNAWNQRRREEALIVNLEAMQTGLSRILDMVNDVNRIPPLVMNALVEGILRHYLGLTEGEDGFAALQVDEAGLILRGAGPLGRELQDTGISWTELQNRWPIIREAVAKKASVLSEDMAATPLRFGGEVLGVLVARKGRNVGANLHLLDTYGVQALNLIEHSKLYEELDQRNLELSKTNQAMVDLLGRLSQSERLRTEFERLSCIDGLTGVANRRHLENQIVEELARSGRHGSTLACAMIDIDRFKYVNDTYGHAAGDHVLKELGSLFVSCKRPYDVIGRYGGEEFVLLLKQISPEDSMALSERVRLAVQNHPFTFEGKRLKITVSIGVVWVAPSSANTLELILKRADQALYSAKTAGRNQCVQFSDDTGAHSAQGV